jgi:hypothetical protein
MAYQILSMGQRMTQQGAIITVDTGISHIKLKIFFVWSNLNPYDFK